MQFNIPKSFVLGAQKIDVKYKEFPNGNSNADGFAGYSEQVVELKTNMKNDYMEFVFFHELVHHILNQTGDEELRIDEKFVNRFATFLHQAIKTMK